MVSPVRGDGLVVIHVRGAGLPFSRGFADFRENEVSESAKKTKQKQNQLISEKKKSGPIYF